MEERHGRLPVVGRDLRVKQAELSGGYVVSTCQTLCPPSVTSPKAVRYAPG